MGATKGPYYIGRVQRTVYSGKYHYASVEPLVESDLGGTQWVGPVQDARSRFPNRGLVHWHEIPTGLQVGSLWQFTVDEQPSDRPEQYQLESAHEPIEVLDLRDWTDEVALQSALTGDGVSLQPAPIARRVLLWLVSGVCVGPFVLKPGREKDLWAID